MVIDGGMDVAGLVAPLAKPGGAIVMLGAGSISHWAHALQSQLEGQA
jgi:UDP-N-acetylmuramate-alanine ligase